MINTSTSSMIVVPMVRGQPVQFYTFSFNADGNGQACEKFRELVKANMGKDYDESKVTKAIRYKHHFKGKYNWEIFIGSCVRSS